MGAYNVPTKIGSANDVSTIKMCIKQLKNGVGGGLLGKNINFTFLTGEDVDLWCYCFDRDFRHTIYDYICLFHFKVYFILSAAMVCLLNINTRIHEMNQ